MKDKEIQELIHKTVSDELQDFRNDFHKEFASVLHDISYRINVLNETKNNSNKIHTSDFNLPFHLIDGYTFTNNSPSAGYVAWSDVNISYKGQTYAIADGNTNDSYIWWQMDASDPTKLQFTNSKPTLTPDDVLLGINDGGTFTLTMESGQMVPGQAILGGSISSDELGSNSVTSLQIASGAVLSGSIASGAVGTSQLASSAVQSGNIASGAVVSGKLGSGAVATSNIANGAVTAGTIANSTITHTQISDSAGIVGSQLANGTISSTQLGSNSVTSTQIASGAVGSSALASGAVTNASIGAGAVASSNLNIATHLLF